MTGGKSSICFGSDEPVKVQAKPVVPAQQQAAAGPAPRASAPLSNIINQVSNTTAPSPQAQKKQSANGNASSMGSIINQDVQAAGPARRVRQTPGGNSSIIFG